MFIPGALISGCYIITHQDRLSYAMIHIISATTNSGDGPTDIVISNHQSLEAFFSKKNKMFSLKATLGTLRISGVSEFGPLEEKYATLGAGAFPITVLLASICTTGFLCSSQE